ncbi:hypothetical protein [Flaviaesturariibacter amylovorans]|uniref:Uncharacterized protein n=1 Tax=Flaviaesturariibacter amylovorans TaxID=1084520 RepID=A0ABP8HVH0_9BACT
MSLKRFLPFESFTLRTKLPAAEVLRRIHEATGPPAPFGSGKSAATPYTGRVGPASFEISRNIDYRNSFLPTIRGRIGTYIGMTEVTVRMQPATAVLVFMAFWLGAVGLVCVGILAAAVLHFDQLLREGFSPMLLIPFGMFAFGCALVTLGFRGESRQSKQFLQTLLEAERTPA